MAYKILIVDDNITNLDILVELLDQYDVLEATNGKDALEILKLEQVDLMILDVVMPDMDGFELCNIIKQDPRSKNTPVIFITGKVDDQSITKGFELGGVDYITKPFNAAEIQARVKNHLKLNQTINQLKQLSNDIMTNTKFATIGQMAAGITHEINTPLTYIKGTLEMCRDDIDQIEKSSLKNTLLEDSKTILDGINRIAIIIESMKEISSDQKLEKTAINIYDTIITVLVMIYNRSKHISNIYINGVIFDINNIDKNTYTLYANAHKQKLEQVWTIILNNALDELEKTGNFNHNKIDINLNNNQSNLVIEISNNGGAIDDNILKNIFEPFITNKSHKGIGIGLSVAKKIIDEHNGTIDVRCNSNTTTFKVKI